MWKRRSLLIHRANKWNSAITFIGCEHFTRKASLPCKSWPGSPLYSYWLWTFSMQLGLVMSKQQNCFGLLTQEPWSPGHKFYNFIAHLENPICLSPQQSLLGVQVRHLPSSEKGMLNDWFFLACMSCVVHIGIPGRAPWHMWKTSVPLVSMDLSFQGQHFWRMHTHFGCQLAH